MQSKLITILVMLSFVYAHSQSTKRKLFKVNTIENLEGINKEAFVMRGKRVPFSILTNFPIEYIPEDVYGGIKHYNWFRLNYKIDKNGNIFFIKGNQGFPKVVIPEEFIGLDRFYYNDDIFLARLNHHISNYKAQHFENEVAQADCRKLSNVVFYCEIMLFYEKKK